MCLAKWDHRHTHTHSPPTLGTHSNVSDYITRSLGLQDPKMRIDDPFWEGRVVFERAAGLLILIAFLLGMKASRRDALPEDLQLTAIFISPGVSRPHPQTGSSIA